MPLADGRFGFCHVIDLPARVLGGRARGQIMVETSSWIGEAAPDLNDPRLREVLVQTHHDWGPNAWRVMVRGPAPDSFERLGTFPPQPDAARSVLAVFTFWETLAQEVLTQWRWDHDREALLRDEQEAAERRTAKQQLADKRQKDDRDHLTLDALRKKRRFSLWKGDRPEQAIAACRKAFREMVDALIALGPKPVVLKCR